MHSPLQLPRQLVWPDHTQEDFRRMLPREAFETLLEMWDIVTEDEDNLPNYVYINNRQITVNPVSFFNEARYLATILVLWPHPERHDGEWLCERLVGSRIEYENSGRRYLNTNNFQLLLLEMVCFLTRASVKRLPGYAHRDRLIYNTLGDWVKEFGDEDVALFRMSQALLPLCEKADNIDVAQLLPEPLRPQSFGPQDSDCIIYYVRSIGDERDFERLLRLYRTKERPASSARLAQAS